MKRTRESRSTRGETFPGANLSTTIHRPCCPYSERRPAWWLGGPMTEIWAKPRYAKFLWKKKKLGYVKAEAYGQRRLKYEHFWTYNIYRALR